MRYKIYIPFAFALCILFMATNSLGGEKTAIKSPSAFLTVDIYEFEPVIDGIKVTHDFIIQNKGTAPLQKVVGASAREGENIDFKVEEIKGPKGRVYLLAVENMKREKGRYYDAIFLKTDNKIRPEIQINVFGNILDRHQK
jgi:hypothetical protein